MHRRQMISGIVLLCIVPSSVALSPHCSTVPLSQRPVCDSPVLQFFILTVARSHRPLYQRPWSHCPWLRRPGVQLSHCPIVQCRTVYCPIVPSSHCRIVELSIVPVPMSFHCPNVPLCFCASVHCAFVHCPVALLSYCRIARLSDGPLSQRSIVPGPVFPLSHCDIAQLFHCHIASMAISQSPHGRIALSSHCLFVRPIATCTLTASSSSLARMRCILLFYPTPQDFTHRKKHPRQSRSRDSSVGSSAVRSWVSAFVFGQHAQCDASGGHKAGVVKGGGHKIH
jgi:hypothetical protein